MPRLPRWAEKHFSLKCTEGDAIASRPDEDANGWDYFVEFPQAPHSGAAEARPPIRSAFVQVKSTTGSKRKRVKIKLSNVLNACRSPDPWFYVLIARGSAKTATSVYVLHVWEELIRKGLAAIRAASLEGVALHRRTISLEFTEESKVAGCVVDAMRTTIEAVSQDYGTTKRMLSDTVGFEDGHGIGQFTLVAESEEELLRSLLGLGRGVTVKDFSYTPSRFGIPDPNPDHSVSNTKVEISPSPIDECEVQVRGPADEPSIVLPGQIFALALPGLADHKKRMRFSAPPLELVISKGSEGYFNVAFDVTTQRPLSYFDTYGRLTEWARQGALDIRVRRGGAQIWKGVVPFNAANRSLETLVPSVAAKLMKIAGRRAHEISFHFDDLNASICTLGVLAQTLSETTLRIEFDATDVQGTITSLLYYGAATVGPWWFGCIVKRKVLEDIIVGERRHVTAGPPILLESYALPAGSEENVTVLRAEYERVEDALDQHGGLLAFGDIVEFVNSLEQAQIEDRPGVAGQAGSASWPAE